MSLKAVTTQQFTVVHLLLKHKTANEKPKGYLVASISIGQPSTTVASTS